MSFQFGDKDEKEALNGIQLITKDQIDNMQRMQRDYSVADNLKTQEENRWHEEQLTTKKLVQQKIVEYKETFTIHGLTRIFTGKRIESLFWLAMVLTGILCCSFIMHGLVTRYLEREIYAQISSEMTNTNFFPAVTFCEKNLLEDSYFNYCGLYKKRHPARDDKYCMGREHVELPADIKSVPDQSWSNGIFTVTSCFGWDGKSCLNRTYLRSLSAYDNKCFTWNFDGKFYDLYGHAIIQFSFTWPSTEGTYANSTPKIIAVFHDPKILEIDLTKTVNISPNKVYDITIDKTMIKRLPAPFPSNCSDDQRNHIFPGKYARRSCLESYSYIEMYKKCGDIFDHLLLYIPKDIKLKYARNNTQLNVSRCLFTFSSAELHDTKNCPFPCEEMDLAVVSTFNDQEKIEKNTSKKFSVNVQYQRVDTTRNIEERELYSWSQMACEIGGFVGLVIGASVISIVEIITYIVLVTINKWVV